MPRALHSMLVNSLLPLLLLGESRTVTMFYGVRSACVRAQSVAQDGRVLEVSTCACECSAPEISPVFASSCTLSILAYDVSWLERHFFCVCKWCICVYTYADVYTGARAHVGARDMWNWCLLPTSLIFHHLVFGDRVSPWTWSSQFQLGWHAIKAPVSASPHLLCWGYSPRLLCPAIYMRSGDPSSGPHACTVNTLPWRVTSPAPGWTI